MARILVQTDDSRTVLDQRDVQVVDLNDVDRAVLLLDRLEEAVEVAESTHAAKGPVARGGAFVRLAVIEPASDYRSVGA